MSFEKDLYTLCTNNTTINSYIDNKFFPYFVPQDETLPVATYEVDYLENIHLSDKDSNTKNIKLFINIFSDSFSQSQEIRKAFQILLDRYNGISGETHIQKSIFIKGGSLYNETDEIYNTFLQFKISYY